MPCLFVGTPLRGGEGYHPVYVKSLNTLRNLGYILSEPREIYYQDVVRVRSRLVADFLSTGGPTHLLFVDADVGFAPQAVEGMLAAQKDYVCCPYPKKALHWDRLQETEGLPLEAQAYDYSIGFLPGERTVDIATSTISGVSFCGLGLTLLSRGCIQRMCDHYGQDESLLFHDVIRGGSRLTVALFQLMVRDRHLLPEDYSFGTRWRDIGGEIHCYLGPGSPATHVGEHVYRGRVEAFCLTRSRHAL